MNSNKILLSIVFALALFPLSTKLIHASRGHVRLVSTTNEDYYCRATSYRMQNLEYRIPFECFNLIYPAGENIYNYVMWATPSNGGNSFKLGVLGLGKGEYKTKTSFSSLFVTTESTKDTKTPTGIVVMRGNVQSFETLEGLPSTPSLTPAPGEEEQTTVATPIEESQPQQELSTRQKLVLALQRAGIAALFALVALIGIIFVVSRSRG